MSDLPILSVLQKKLILILGMDYVDNLELCRFTARDIKYHLNKYNEKYNKPYQKSINYSSLNRLEQSGLIETVMDRINGRKIKFFMLTENGIEWYYKAKEMEQNLFQD